jgi:hypothetical protein
MVQLHECATSIHDTAIQHNARTIGLKGDAQENQLPALKATVARAGKSAITWP